MTRVFDLRSAWIAAAWFTLATVVMTWPVVLHLPSRMVGDLGDSVLNCWILAWTGDHLLALLRGDLGALATYWHTNIFTPEPYTLAYSEHLTALTLQILPVYALTGNVLLCYNLLFLSTSILSGLGVYLLVRHVTGQATAAFVAGLLYAFTPYRVAQLPHLQVLASQWMPFALYGFRRYLDTGSRRALAWGTVALVAQNLSCGYYLLFFAPLVVLYVLYELVDRGRLRDAIAWRDFSAAGVGAGVATLPFLLPYVRLKAYIPFKRGLDEVISFSADVHGYANASDRLHFWGSLPSFTKAENELFPGVIPVALGAGALVVIAVEAWRRHGDRESAAPWRRAASWLLGLGVVGSVAALVMMLIIRGSNLDVGPFHVGLRNGSRILVGLAVFLAGWALSSPGARRMLRGVPGSLGGFAFLSTLLACWLSFGPAVQSMGLRVNVPAAYLPFYLYVPGYDGLRVPARFAMLAFLMLAVLAGYGLAWIARRGRAGQIAALACGLAVLVEVNGIPYEMDRVSWEAGYGTPPLLEPTPAVYGAYDGLPPDAIVLEFPIGNPGYDLRSEYYSRLHRRRLVNGYSGMFPPWYGRVVTDLGQLHKDPEVAWSTLRDTRATHVLVREAAYLEREFFAIEAWLQARGARVLMRAGSNVLFALPSRTDTAIHGPAAAAR